MRSILGNRRRHPASTENLGLPEPVDILRDGIDEAGFWQLALEPELHRPANASIVMRDYQQAWGKVTDIVTHPREYPPLWTTQVADAPNQIDVHTVLKDPREQSRALKELGETEVALLFENWLLSQLRMAIFKGEPPYLHLMTARKHGLEEASISSVLIIAPKSICQHEREYASFFKTHFECWPSIQPLWRDSSGGGFVYSPPKGEKCELDRLAPFTYQGEVYLPFLLQKLFSTQTTPQAPENGGRQVRNRRRQRQSVPRLSPETR